MDETSIKPVDEDLVAAPETPEDVAVLYTWANVHGGKYRDFSASRREFRAQQRHRIAEAQRLAELEAARAREEAAARELEEARRAERDAVMDEQQRAEAEEALRRAEERASQERMEAQRHVEQAEELKRAMEQAQREMEEARRRAEEQAARWREADARWRALNPEGFVPGEIDDPYYYAGPLEPTAFAPGKGVRSSVPQRVSSERRIVESYYRSQGRKSGVYEGSSRRVAEDRDNIYGIFSSGRRASSGARAVYREIPSVVPQGDLPPAYADQLRPMSEEPVEPRLEILEDMRERHRPDELDRLTETHGGSQSAWMDEVVDPYSERAPRPYALEESGSRNTAAADLHIRPRVQQTRTGLGRDDRRMDDRRIDERAAEHRLEEHGFREEAHPLETRGFVPERQAPAAEARMRPSSESSAERRIVRSEDPEPGNTHPLEPRRRRESSTDLSARTARRPRFSDPVRPSEDAEERLPVAPESRLPAMPESASAASSADAVEAGLRGDDGLRREERPEWLNRREPKRVAPDFPYSSAPVNPEIRSRTSGEPLLRERFRNRTSDVTRVVPVQRDPARPEAASYDSSARASSQEPEQTREPQFVRAPDGGFNLRPMTDRPPQHAAPVETPRTTEGKRESLSSYTPSRMTDPRLESRGEQLPAAMPPRMTESRAETAQEFTPSRMAESRREPVAAPPAPPAPVSAPPPVSAQPPAPVTPPAPLPPAPAAPPAAPQLMPMEQFERRREVRPIAETPRRRAGDLAENQRAAAAPGQPGVLPRPSRSTDTLQQSRERVAARWFALKGLVGPNSGETLVDQSAPARSKDVQAPVIAVVSLSGGVGKTSIVATLGRSLSAAGEKVLLVDTTAHGLLPYYFGSREFRPGVVRTFSPPPGSSDATVYMVNYETDRLYSDDAGQAQLVEDLKIHSRGTQRAILDLTASSAWLARRLARLNGSILVPIAPDMNSVVGIQAVERYFAGAVDSEGRPVSPFYVLNQFDASVPLHLDVREVLRQQLGNRLLPVMIRRSPAVSEALAEGMTVIDYAPGSPVTEDFSQLAEWVRSLAAPAATGMRGIRWSER